MSVIELIALLARVATCKISYTFHTSARFLVLLRVIHRAPIYLSRPELLVRKTETLPERERDTLVKKTENTPRNESDQRHHSEGSTPEVGEQDVLNPGELSVPAGYHS
jgi:hypothetical protein